MSIHISIGARPKVHSMAYLMNEDPDEGEEGGTSPADYGESPPGTPSSSFAQQEMDEHDDGAAAGPGKQHGPAGKPRGAVPPAFLAKMRAGMQSKMKKKAPPKGKL